MSTETPNDNLNFAIHPCGDRFIDEEGRCLQCCRTWSEKRITSLKTQLAEARKENTALRARLAELEKIADQFYNRVVIMSDAAAFNACMALQDWREKGAK